MYAVTQTGEETMSQSPDTRCYGSVGAGWDERLYTRCDACGWRGGFYEADQHDEARGEAERHSDLEVRKEMAEWVELNWSEKNNPFFTEETNLYLNVQSEEKNS